MLKRWLVGIGFVGVTVFSLSTCRKDNALLVDLAVDCDTVEVSFTQDIVPLFANKCSTGLGGGTGCHDSWTGSYEILSKKAFNGRLETYVISNRSMPEIPNNWGVTPLTEDEINRVHCWLFNGAPNN